MRNYRRRVAGFTLIELLVVIGIIGVLAALITAAAGGAMSRAREAAILTEIDQMAIALNQYKSEYGSYPPNFSDASAVRRHLKRRFPRIDPAELNTIEALNLNPAQALVFWLRGFANNPRLPHTGATVREQLYGFDVDRLVHPDTGNVIDPDDPDVFDGTLAFPIYLPQHGWRDPDPADPADIPNVLRPFIYFASDQYSVTSYSADSGGKRPYRKATDTDTNGDPIPQGYVNRDSFQIIAAGLDGEWGNTTNNPVYFPIGFNYTRGDRDNLTNFSTSNLWDSIP